MYPSLIVVHGTTGKVLTTWGRFMLQGSAKKQQRAIEGWLRGESGETR